MAATGGQNGQWQTRKKKAQRISEARKQSKIHGTEYTTYKGEVRPARTPGKDCNCKKKCFQVVPPSIRGNVFKQFYDMVDKNEQDSHLCGLIDLLPIQRRRVRATAEENRKTKCGSFSYKIRHNGKVLPVCQNGFLSIHGITPGRLRRLQTSLVTTGKSPRDCRGQHKNRTTKYPTEIINVVKQHIMSFKPRTSHYSRRENPDYSYLPESLTVKDMHAMFLSEYRINIPYKIYWRTFRSEFKIKFGFPRSDTCPLCDNYQQKLNNKNLSVEDKNTVMTEKNLPLRKAEAFHSLKKKYKLKAQAGEVACLSFDFMQNLPLPHIPTNPVFYARQLWYNVFSVHNLANSEATMYTYHEGEAKKGCNDVTSMLLHYINAHALSSRSLVLFSDGCPGQNKNYVMVHFLYFLVHVLKCFDSILYIFPMRGHSFLPNDQDFALIEKKKRRIERVEIPQGWDNLILKAREQPSPFELVKMDQSKFFDIKGATQKYFLKMPKPAIQIKNVRQIKIEADTFTVSLRDSYNGLWRTSIVRNKLRLPSEFT